jgi:hypothetical protein
MPARLVLVPLFTITLDTASSDPVILTTIHHRIRAILKHTLCELIKKTLLTGLPTAKPKTTSKTDLSSLMRVLEAERTSKGQFRTAFPMLTLVSS